MKILAKIRNDLGQFLDSNPGRWRVRAEIKQTILDIEDFEEGNLLKMDKKLAIHNATYVLRELSNCFEANVEAGDWLPHNIDLSEFL